MRFSRKKEWKFAVVLARFAQTQWQSEENSFLMIFVRKRKHSLFPEKKTYVQAKGTGVRLLKRTNNDISEWYLAERIFQQSGNWFAPKVVNV